MKSQFTAVLLLALPLSIAGELCGLEDTDHTQPPVCEDWINWVTDFKNIPFFFHHTMNCSRYWMCEPSLRPCLMECPPMATGGSLQFKQDLPLSVGPVTCDWPSNVQCHDRPKPCSKCEAWQTCVEDAGSPDGWSCTPQCIVDQQCDEGEVCTDEGECGSEGCTGDSDCTASACSICVDSQCYDPDCCTDDDCGATACSTCSDSHQCFDPECCGHSDCGEDEYCNGDGECASGCKDNSSCSGNGSCSTCGVDHVCSEPECCNDDECSECSVCLVDNTCSMPECCSNDDCVSGVCDIENNVCQECIADADCSGCAICQEDNTCSKPECCSNDDCVSGVCDEENNICQECLIDPDCSGCAVCQEDNTCSEPECCSNEDCINAVCDAENNVCQECMADSDCSGCAVCQAGNTCSKPECCSNDDCQGGNCDLDNNECIPVPGGTYVTRIKFETGSCSNCSVTQEGGPVVSLMAKFSGEIISCSTSSLDHAGILDFGEGQATSFDAKDDKDLLGDCYHTGIPDLKSGNITWTGPGSWTLKENKVVLDYNPESGKTSSVCCVAGSLAYMETLDFTICGDVDEVTCS